MLIRRYGYPIYFGNTALDMPCNISYLTSLFTLPITLSLLIAKYNIVTRVCQVAKCIKIKKKGTASDQEYDDVRSGSSVSHILLTLAVPNQKEKESLAPLFIVDT